MQLILDKKGSSIAIKNGRFWVRSGDIEQFIAPSQIHQICLHAATKLTYEVVAVAIENQVDIQFIDRKGFPFGRVWSNRFGSISTIRKNQVAFAASIFAPAWVRGTLIRKIDNQLAVIKLLESWQPINPGKANEAAAKLQKYQDKLRRFTIEDAHEAYASFRGFEGSCSRVYFGYISSFLPPAYSFEKRSQHPAKDMFNCLLNYAYGMLYGHVEGALIKAGIDPFLGVMHRDEYNRPVLSYDFIELFRYWADYVVCHLCNQEVIYQEFFEVQNQSYWLNVSGKRILIHTFNDYLNEVVMIDNLSRSRLNHIAFEAQKLASKMKSFVAS